MRRVGFILLIEIVLLLYGPDVAETYPSGAPSSVCESGKPWHTRGGLPTQPQNTSLPYDVNINTTTFQPGDTVRIEIVSKKGEGFRGMLLQVVELVTDAPEGSNMKHIGSFSRVTMNTKPLKCGDFLNSLTHRDGFAKERVVVDWKAPLYVKSDVKIRATFVANFTTFWINATMPRIELLRTDGQQAPETLRLPWLRQIAESVELNNNVDKHGLRDGVRDRFTKGLSDIMTPNEYIMIHYVNDMIPFRDHPPGTEIQSRYNVSDIVRRLSGETVSTILSDNPASPANITRFDESVNGTLSPDSNSDPQYHSDERIVLFDTFIQALLSDNIHAAHLLDTAITLVNVT